MVPVQPAEPLAHIARDGRRSNFEHQVNRNHYKELPLTGCRLCATPHYLLPNSFSQNFPLWDDGEIDDNDISQLAGLPRVFDEITGEWQHFLANFAGTVATAADFQQDAVVFERCFGRDVRFLHHHSVASFLWNARQSAQWTPGNVYHEDAGNGSAEGAGRDAGKNSDGNVGKGIDVAVAESSGEQSSDEARMRDAVEKLISSAFSAINAERTAASIERTWWS